MVAESGQTPTVHVADERQVLVLDVEFGHQSTCRHFLVANAQEAVDTGLRFPPDHGFNEARMTDLQIRGGGMGSGHTVNSSPAEGHGSDRCWCPAPFPGRISGTKRPVKRLSNLRFDDQHHHLRGMREGQFGVQQHHQQELCCW